MNTVHKKQEEKKEPSFAKASAGKEEKASKPIVVSDIVTQTSERVEVIEEVEPSKNPLADFKEKMSEEEEYPPYDSAPKKNFMWPILFVFIIAILMLGGIFVYKKGMITSEKVNVVTLSPTPTLTPQPTKTVDLTKYEIEILNGSEVSGEAGRQRTSLEEQGFTISAVGNASNSNYTDTIIQAKEEVDKDFIAKLKSTLEGTFTVGEIEVLSDDALTPIVVILGTKK